MPKFSFPRITAIFLLFVCVNSLGLIGIPGQSHFKNDPTIFITPEAHFDPNLLPKALSQEHDGFSSTFPLSTSSVFEDPEYLIEALAVADFNQDGSSDIAVAGTWDNGTSFLDGSTGQLLYNNSDPKYPVNLFAVGDFNDDGVPDVAAGAEKIYFLDGRTGQTLYTTPKWATAFAVTDFTNDGIPDVAAASFKEVHLIDGSTGEILWTNLDPQESVFTLAISDVNQDNVPDVIAGSRDTNVYFLDGTTGTTLYQNSDPTKWVEDLAVADFTQDGIDDLVVGSWDKTVYFVDGSTGKTLYTNSDPTTFIRDLAVADFTQDGTPDVAASSDTVYILDGGIGETLWTTEEALVFYGESIVLGDFNKDSIMDIAVVSLNEISFVDGLTGELLYENTESKEAIKVSEGGDFNGDGVTDIIASIDVLYCINGATGTTIWARTPPTWDVLSLEEPFIPKPGESVPMESMMIPPPKPPKERIDLSIEAHPRIFQVNTDPTESIESLAVADFTHDGIDDLVVGSWDDTVYFLDGATGQTMFTNAEPWWMIEALAVADFNNDGTPDVAAGADQIYFLDGATGETLRTSIGTGVGQGIECIALADFNQDGMPDVVVGGVKKTIYFVDGASGETLYENTDPGAVVASLAVADFTQDGVPDVVAGSWDKTVYAIDGTSGETLWTNTEPDDFVQALGIEDFNADGVPDVAAGADGVYFLDGTSGETLWNYADPYGSIDDIKMVDLNNDGILDIAASPGNVYLIDGASGELIWENREGTAPSEYVRQISLGDFNNDGTSDVAAGTDGKIYLIDGVTGKTFFRYTEPKARVDHIVMGDFNGDGISDVAGGSEDSNVYVVISDHFAPDLQYCQLPEIPSSEVPLDFQVIYEEPNIDTIQMGYFNEGEIHTIAPSSSTENTVDFTLPEVQQSPLEFWFWANDTWGNIRAQGNETNSYSLDLALERIWMNTELTFSVNSLVLADFTGDRIPDVMGADNTDIYFINGSTGETLYGTEDVIVTAWALKTADFNLDGISDVAAASDYIYFVDGSTGETLVTSKMEMGIVWAIDSTDFNQDGIPDVVVGDHGGNVIAIDGWTGETIWNNSVGVVINVLVTADLTLDGVSDVIVGALDSNIYIFDGANGVSIYANTDPIIASGALTVRDFDQDGNLDVLAGADALYCINAWKGELLWTNMEPLGAINAIKLADFNYDAIPDVIAGTDAGEVYICDGGTGESIFRVQVAGPIDNGHLELADVTKDGVPDVIAVTMNPAILYIIDGRLGKIRESIALEAPATSNIVVADFDQNGFPDVGIGHPDGQVTVIQPLSQMYDLFPSLDQQMETINQGERINFLVDMKDVFGRNVHNAEVTLLVRRVGTEPFTSYGIQNLGNGSYSVSLSTSDWRFGEWHLYLVANSLLHNELELKDYIDLNGYYLSPSKTLQVVGEILPEFTLVNEAGPFANSSQVLENTNITLQIYLQDAFYHALSPEEATVLVSFVGPHTQARFEQGRFVTTLPTKGLNHGFYQIGITIWGPHGQKSQHSIIIEIVPQFPAMEFSLQTILIGAAVSFVVLLLLARGVDIVHDSLKTNPEAALKTSKRIIYADFLLLLLTLGGGGVLFFINPVLSFLVILIAFGEILILFLLWFFKVIFIRVNNFEEEAVSIKSWLSTLLLSGLVAFPMALSLFIGSQIEWFNYHIYQDITNLRVISIPTLYIEEGIVGFASGVLLVIISAIIGTNKNIEHLKAKKAEIEEEYKDPSTKMQTVLATEISAISSNSFASLLKSLVAWYVIVIYTFFVTFQLFPYFQVVGTVVASSGSAVIISGRRHIRGLVRRG